MRGSPYDADERAERFVAENGRATAEDVARHLSVTIPEAIIRLCRLIASGRLSVIIPEDGKAVFAPISHSGEGVAIPSPQNWSTPATHANGEKLESNEYYARRTPVLRARTPSEIIDSEGFVCHPSATKKALPNTFVKAFYKGGIVAEVIRRGDTSDCDSEDGTSVHWDSKADVEGDLWEFGTIYHPDGFFWSIEAMTAEGGSAVLRITLSPRWIHIDNALTTADAEFRLQASEVMDFLSQRGWVFGNVTEDGNLCIEYPVITTGMMA